MIDIPRARVRHFRAVLRRALLGRERSGSWPLLLCRVDQHGLTLQSGHEEIALRFQLEGNYPPEEIAFRSSVLADFEGRTDAPVTLEQLDGGKGRARWTDGGVPQVVEFDTVTPDSVPGLPAEPREWAPMPETFLAALTEAVNTTPPESGRLGLSRVQLRGQSGTLVGTDGRELLLQGGFCFPWSEDLLVPRLPVFGCRDPVLEGAVRLGRFESHVVLGVGPWAFWLKIDADSRYPRVEEVIPQAKSLTSRLRVAPEDAQFLLHTLPRLPGEKEHLSPVTLDLGPPVAIRARSQDQGPVTEVVLNRSSVEGKSLRVQLNRRYLGRALHLGFTEVALASANTPLVCRDQQRVYLWMPLDKDAAIAPGPDMIQISSGEPAPVSTPVPPPVPAPLSKSPSSERRRLPMPAPSRNGQEPEKNPPANEPERGGIEELIAEAEAVRGLLNEALGRTTRLLAALKQHRRQARAVRAAVASLRELHLDR